MHTSKIFSRFYRRFICFVADTSSLIVFFLQTIFKPSESIYTINGDNFWVRKNSSDILVLKEVYKKKVYGATPQGVVLDIGANIGAFSVYASTTADTVYAFEPESSNYVQLVKNIALNKRDTKIIPLNVAVGRENKEIHMYKGKFNKGASSAMYKVTDEKETVQMRSLSDLMDELGIQKVNFLKIDIEGGEYNLLYGLPKEKFEKIDTIALEYHHVDGESYVNLANHLVSLGYTTSMHKGFGLLIGSGTIVATKNASFSYGSRNHF